MDRCQRGAAALANPFVKLAPPCHVSRMQHTSYMLRRQFQWCGDVSNWMQILYILVGTYWWKNCTLFVERKSWGMRMRVAAVHEDYLYIEKLSVLVGVQTANWKRDTTVTASTVPSVTYLATNLCSWNPSYITNIRSLLRSICPMSCAMCERIFSDLTKVRTAYFNSFWTRQACSSHHQLIFGFASDSICQTGGGEKIFPGG